MEDKLAERWNTQQQNAHQGPYFWVTGVCNGKRFLYGPEVSEEAANNLGLQKAGVQFELFQTSGRDRAAAGQKLKAMLLQKSHDLPESMQRLKRKPEYKRAGGNH